MIKQGYMVTIVSYAGDLDNYNTFIKSGLTLDQARWLVRWYDCYFMLIKHENFEATDETFAKASTHATKKVGGFYPPFDFNCDELEVNGLCTDDLYNDLAYEILGAACEYTGGLRKPESIKTYLIPTDILDISDQVFAVGDY